VMLIRDPNESAGRSGDPEKEGIMELRSDAAFFGITIPIDDFAALALQHSQLYIDTSGVESEGGDLVAADFPDDACADFVRSVCRWGGYSGVGGRVIKNSTPTAISTALRAANGVLQAESPDPESALRFVNGLKGLGTPSFASKHLRFLAPRVCPVFDDYLRVVLPYSFGPRGYSAFAADCSVLASALTSRGAANPWAGRDGEWYAADVEAAIFQWARSHR